MEGRDLGTTTTIIIITRYLNFNALWLVAERGGVLFFEATLGLDKREAHSWCSSIYGEKACGGEGGMITLS